MAAECHYTTCPFHDKQTPFCYEEKCKATREELKTYELAHRLKLKGYSLDELDRDNPYNQWMNE